MSHGTKVLTPLPLLTADLPGIGGKIKVFPEDFEVEEIPAYQPSGQGAYLYLWLEKRDMSADFFARQIAQRLEVPVSEIGTAGLKDRRAVVRQMVSVPEEAVDRIGQLEGDGIRILDVSRHTNKLKPGHLHGNRFRIVIRETKANAEALLQPIVDRLLEQGLPNFFGPQRFGNHGETALQGFALLRGEKRRLSPFMRKLALSAAQSVLFNRYLAQRMADGLLHQVLPGEVMGKYPAGGIFLAEDVTVEQRRFDNREVVPAGPIFGRKMFAARDSAAQRETKILDEAGLTLEHFAGFGKLTQGTRRHNLVFLQDLKVEFEQTNVCLSFSLPSGSYATVLLRELTKNPEGDDNQEEIV